MINIRKRKILDQFPISSRLIGCNAAKCFALKANGEGLAPQINSTDFLICEETTEFNNKDFIVIQYKNDDVEVFQAIKKDNDLVLLLKTNPHHSDRGMLKPLSELNIAGVIKTIIKTWSIGQN